MASKKGNLIGGIVFLVWGIGFSLLLIAVFNQYYAAPKNESNTECIEFTYNGYIWKNSGVIVYIQENDKPLYFSKITYSKIDENLMSDMPKGTKFKAYVINTRKDDYSYEIVQMEFNSSGRFVLSFEQYNKEHQRDAIIGFIVVPILSMVAIIISAFFFILFFILRRNEGRVRA